MIIDMTVSAIEHKLTEKQAARDLAPINFNWDRVNFAPCGFKPDTIEFFTELATSFTDSCVKLELSEWKWENRIDGLNGNITFGTLPTSNNSTYFTNIGADINSPIKWTSYVTNCSFQVD